jgi:hypothetical protein
MARISPRVPELADVLCEACGYVLNGLPPTSRCPECGKPIAESIGENRIIPSWETSSAKADSFLRTSLELIQRPTLFYRTLAVRGSVNAARRFARVHWWIAAGLFALTTATHTFWYWFLLWPWRPWLRDPRIATLFIGIIIVMSIVTYFALDGITRLAARLTNWEATYRGIRLPYDIVLRGMYYHAAHYVPVALAAAVTVVGYQILLTLRVVSPLTSDRYLYVLSAQVILSAVYLFHTYWIGMRNMMYANR